MYKTLLNAYKNAVMKRQQSLPSGTSGKVSTDTPAFHRVQISSSNT
jgi:hypothetical protein